jgi:hypothetical protein
MSSKENQKQPRKTASAFATVSTSSRPVVPTSSTRPQDIAHLYAEQPFSQPIPSAQMGQFEILRKDQAQCNATNFNLAFLPPLCIAAAAVTERCCEKKLGMVSIPSFSRCQQLSYYHISHIRVGRLHPSLSISAGLLCGSDIDSTDYHAVWED